MTLDILVKTYKIPKEIPKWLAGQSFSFGVTSNEPSPTQTRLAHFIFLKSLLLLPNQATIQ